MDFEKYHKIKILGDRDNSGILSNPKDEICIEEKVDGANFRFTITKDGYPMYGSRSRELEEKEFENKAWKKCIAFISGKLKDKDLSKYQGLIFYGECMTRHSIHYDWDNTPSYLGFDIKETIGEDTRYLSYNEKEIIFKDLDLLMVPLIKKCLAGEITDIKEEDIPKSSYYEGQAEGIVMKNYSKQLFAKFVTTKFKEINKKTFGMGQKYAENDDELIVAKYCTNARIDKQIWKLIDEDNVLELPLMKLLPKAVTKDIYEEQWQTILEGNYKLDLRHIRKLITHRCLAVLQQNITNNALVNNE